MADSNSAAPTGQAQPSKPAPKPSNPALRMLGMAHLAHTYTIKQKGVLEC